VISSHWRNKIAYSTAKRFSTNSGQLCRYKQLESSWNVMAHGDSREGKWRGNWRMKWVASTLHTTSEHGVSSITTADAHTSAASSRLNWRPCRFKWTRPFRRKTKSVFCACAITFQTQFTANSNTACGLLVLCGAKGPGVAQSSSKDFSSSPNRPDRLGTHPASCSICTGCSFPSD
jgi:hypothetical protein